MRALWYFLIICASVLFVSCGEDENRTVDLNFKLNYDGEPLVFFQEYSYPDGRIIEFTRFSFYISELAVAGEGLSIPVKEAQYVDLTLAHSSAEKAVNGLDLSFDTQSTDDFDAVSFNIGLTAEQNATKPEDYPSSSDLSLSGEYWSNWESYVFVKIEARSDLDGDGISEGIALHLGSDNAMRPVQVNDVNSAKQINLSMDLYDLFVQNGEIYDLENNARIHSLNQIPLIDWLMDSLESSIEVSQ